MTARSYTVAEIAALRQAVENKFLWGRYQPVLNGSSMSRCHTDSEKAAYVEQTVRTHMAAGHTAADIYASEG